MNLRRPLLTSCASTAGIVFALLASACDMGTTSTPTPFDAVYANASFQECKDCHAQPRPPGFVAGTEATQDWSSSEAAFSSLHGKASGLVGNFAACNGVPLIGMTSSTSLLIASLDADVRATFVADGVPACNGTAISDQTLKLTHPLDPAALQQLKDFIDHGGFE